MNVKIIQSGERIHHLARFFYWLSILLLLGGMWLMIDPYNRKPGQTNHVYITLTAFELYVWLLLLLARWQGHKLLIKDTARSGLFAVVLVGLQFMVLNELYMASALEAYLMSILMIGLTAAKLIAARSWLGISLPGPVMAFCLGWIVCLALPAPVIKIFEADKSFQHGIGYIACWLVAFFMAAHLLLVRWQIRKGNYFDSRVLGQWWVGWLLLVVLSALTVIQLYAVMWGLFVEWSQWYFSPICLAFAMVALTLSYGMGRRFVEGWLLMLLAVLYAASVCSEAPPQEFPTAWLDGSSAYVVHPIYPSGVFVTMFFVAAGLLMGRLWLYGMAAVFPVGASLVKGTFWMWHWRNGKGLAMLLGAFLMLAAGALIQWWQQRWGIQRRALLSNLDDNAEGASNPSDGCISKDNSDLKEG